MESKQILMETRYVGCVSNHQTSHSFSSKYVFDNEWLSSLHRFIFEGKSITVASNNQMHSGGYVKMEIDIGSIKTSAKLWVLENLCTGITLGLD